jgi:tRNA A-37 threonylcarbamoyl transferase component Bud32/Tol biopolymer transport system component
MADLTLISRRYEVIEKVGQGGMATVYKVRHTTLGSISALKVLPQDLMEDPEMVSRFYREARIMAQLGHPNIVRVLDIDHDEALNFHYLVMEYVEGQTLRERLDAGGPLPLAETLTMGRQVGSALAYAHGHVPPIVHRDIKPSNIMIEAVTGRFVLMDFGIAKELGSGELTRPGVTVGTLRYCPPEQMRQEPLDGSADVYALGMVVLEAYAGWHPLTGLRDRELIARVLDETTPHQPVFPDESPTVFRDLVKKAIAKRRADRLGSVTELLRGIDAVQEAAERESADQRARAAAEERERRRQAELEIRARERAERTSASRGAARSAGAERHAREIYERASAEAVRAERLMGSQSWEEAGQAFVQAMALFEEATRAAEREKYREEARRLRAEAASLLDVAERERARERVPERFLDIDALLATAGRSFDNDDLTTARSGFERVVGLLREARDAASRRLERDAAERERERAQSMSERARGAGNRVGRRSERRLRQAEKEFQAERFVEARRLYKEAAEVLEAELVPLSGSEDETIIAPPEVSEGELGTGLRVRSAALVAAVAGGLVLLASAWWMTRDASVSAVAPRETAEVTGSAGADGDPTDARLAKLGAGETEADTRPGTGTTADEAAGQRGRAAPATGGSAGDPGARPGARPGLESEVASGPEAGAPAVNGRPGGEDAAPPTAPTDASGADAGTRPASGGDVPGGARGPATVEPLARVDDLAIAPTGAATGGPAFPDIPDSPIRRLTSTPKVELALPASGLAEAVLDGKKLAAAKGERLRVVLDKLPAGESQHELRLTDAAGASRTVPIEVTHYPGWVTGPMGKVGAEAYGVDVSPDGRRAVSGSRDNLVKLWDLATGDLVRTFTGHKDWVNDVAFALGGSAVLSGSKDRTLKLWNAETGELLRTMEGHKGWVNAVAVAPDGKRAASVSDDRTVRLWDLESGTQLRSLTGHDDWTFSVAFSPDGRKVVSAGKDNTVRVWDAETGKLEKTLRGHRDWISAVAVAATGDRAVSGSDDRTARIWNLATGKEERTLRGHGDWVVAVAVSPDGKRVVSGSKDGTARLWDIETGKLLRTFNGHRSMVSGVVFAPDGMRVISTGRDRTLRIWWAGPDEIAAPAVASLAPESER